jgi:hypothetical protein
MIVVEAVVVVVVEAATVVGVVRDVGRDVRGHDGHVDTNELRNNMNPKKMKLKRKSQSFFFTPILS